jgi:hypothetical protein
VFPPKSPIFEDLPVSYKDTRTIVKHQRTWHTGVESAKSEFPALFDGGSALNPGQLRLWMDNLVPSRYSGRTNGRFSKREKRKEALKSVRWPGFGSAGLAAACAISLLRLQGLKHREIGLIGHLSLRGLRFTVGKVPVLTELTQALSPFRGSRIDGESAFVAPG